MSSSPYCINVRYFKYIILFLSDIGFYGVFYLMSFNHLTWVDTVYDYVIILGELVRLKKGVSNAEKVVRLITESDFNDSCREDFKNLKFYFFLLR